MHFVPSVRAMTRITSVGRNEPVSSYSSLFGGGVLLKSKCRWLPIFAKPRLVDTRSEWRIVANTFSGQGHRMPNSSVLHRLLPPSVAVAESFDRSSHEWHQGLYPLEVAIVERATESRREDFTAGRNLARRALQHLGYLPCGIARGQCGEPIFQAGISGSITHTGDYCAAALSRIEATGFVGVDAEAAVPLPIDVEAYVLTPAERWARDRADGLYGTRLFCIKEAFYKALFQISGAFMDFQEVSVEVTGEASRAALTVHRKGAAAPCDLIFQGAHVQKGSRIFAAVLLDEAEAQILRDYFAQSSSHQSTSWLASNELIG